MPHTNQTERKYYSHYSDDQIRQIVVEKYKTCLEKFGYLFELEIKYKFDKNYQIKISIPIYKKFMVPVINNFISKANKLKKEERLDEAIALYKQAIELNPGFPWYYYELGETLTEKGDLDEAIAQFFQATKINPNSAWFCYELAKALQKKGELNQAINYYRQAIESNPDFYGFYNSLGCCFFQNKNYHQAIINFLIALELNSSSVISYEYLYQVYLQLGLTKKCIDNLFGRFKQPSQKPTLTIRIKEKSVNSKQELSKTKIFGIGLGKTGTTTLGACLNNLGYKHYGWYSLTNYKLLHQIKLDNFDDVHRVVNQYDCFEDYPWPLIYKWLDQKYPNSKFILTIRKCSQTWFKSCLNHYFRLQDRAAYVYDLIYGLGHPQNCSDEYINFYESHNQQVIDYFQSKPDKLLIICWEKGDSWDKLCGFLGKTVPEIPLPHLMKSQTN